jgi:MoxR-like ATPase
MSDELSRSLQIFNENFSNLKNELQKVIVGQSQAIDLVLTGLFGGGHILLEGSPGVGKTLLVRSLSESLSLEFQRIQFTSDLMPSDIAGTQIIIEDENGKRQFHFRKGPVFTQLLLADEVNRAGPKTQSALLEAMEEKQVTIMGTSHKLPEPFFVLATQNPIELEGTYPLPEAQLDRFMLKIFIPSPNAAELKEVLTRTTGETKYKIKPILSASEAVPTINLMRQLVRKVVVSSSVQDFLISILFSLNPQNNLAPNSTRAYVRYAPGPRGAQSVLLAAKVRALKDQRINVSNDDIKQVILPALRHRLILNFQADTDSMTPDDLIREVAKI